MNAGTGMVSISKEEYEELLEDSRVLTALRNAGVDSWDGYDFAMEDMEEDEDE
jgi:hypothetical protein